MPGSFVASESGPAVRKALLEKCDIYEVWDIPGRVFEASVQPVVIFARKGESKKVPSPQPVRTRICQKNDTHFESFKRDGFTRSDVFPDQSQWTAGRRGGKTTHVFDFTSILSHSEWANIHRNSVSLEEVADIVPGCIKGSSERFRASKIRSRNITLLAKAGTTLPREFVIDYARGELDVRYPDTFEEPRVDSVELLEGEKLLLLSDPNPSWGKRMKLAIERDGAFPGDGFFAIAGKGDCPLSLECLAALIRWKASNAWVVEHLRYPKVNRSILSKVPVPKVLLSDLGIAKKLKTLLLRVERAAIDGRTETDAEREMDGILRAAYGITDESVWERLCAVYRWDEIGDSAPSFDRPSSVASADWSVEGAVEAVDVAQGTLTLWVSGFDELQTVPLCPQFPGWMLRVGAKFRTMVPSLEARKGRLTGEAWGVIEPANYTYLSIEEMTADLNAEMKRRPA